MSAGGTAVPPARQPTWLVAQVLELTGAASAFGDAWRSGVELAVQDINAGGGLLGRLIEVITFDAQSSPAGAHTAMTKALDGEAVAVLGPVLSGPARGAAVVPRGARAWLTGAGAADLTGPAHPGVFRTRPSDAAMMARLAGWLKQGGAAHRLAIYAAASEPYRERADALVRAARAAGLEVVADIAATPDLAGDITRLLHASPDTLALLLPAEASGHAIRLARQDAPALALIGEARLLSPRALDIAGPAAQGVRAHVLMAESEGAPEVQAFQTRYAQRNKEAPDELALAGYLAMAAVRAAITQTGSADARAIAEALPHITLQGGMLWDAAGESLRPSWIVEQHGGRAVPLTTLGV